jgi:Flp pilus assembly protein TadD
MKIRLINGIACAAAAIVLAGCASQAGRGNAPGAVSGSAQSQPVRQKNKQGEFYNTETLTPGIGSALFPDPAWH